MTNGVAGFQRTVDAIVAKENLSDVYVYVDNITIGGMTKEQYDKNSLHLLHTGERAAILKLRIDEFDEKDVLQFKLTK